MLIDMWSQVVMAVLGVWLMVAPAVFGFSRTIADNAHIVGPLVASFSIIAFWECTRNVRLFNLLPAGWLLIAPWVLQYHNVVATINDYAVALGLLALSAVPMRRKHRFAGGWPSLWK